MARCPARQTAAAAALTRRHARGKDRRAGQRRASTGYRCPHRQLRETSGGRVSSPRSLALPLRWDRMRWDRNWRRSWRRCRGFPTPYATGHLGRTDGYGHSWEPALSIGTVRTKTMYDRGVPRAFVLPLAVGARGPDDAPGGWRRADLDETACPVPRGERGGHPWRRRRSVLGLTTIPMTAAI
jgi:hypothetical protein